MDDETHRSSPIRVTDQGAVVAHGPATIQRESQEIVCLTVDLASKYAEAPMFECGDGFNPAVWLTASERTLNLAEDVPRERGTRVEFTGYKGWSVFGGPWASQHTLHLTLVAPERHATAARKAPTTADRTRCARPDVLRLAQELAHACERELRPESARTWTWEALSRSMQNHWIAKAMRVRSDNSDNSDNSDKPDSKTV